jgi:hypothetical protein
MIKFYQSHSSELTPALWAAYVENCIKTEPDAPQLLTNFGVLHVRGAKKEELLTITGQHMELMPVRPDGPILAVEDFLGALNMQELHATHRLQHAFIGIATELFELEAGEGMDIANSDAVFREEGGDLCWYTGLASHVLGIGSVEEFGKFMEHVEISKDVAFLSYKALFKKAVGQFKRFKFYGKAMLREELKFLLVAGLLALQRECTTREIEFRDVLQESSWKLLGKRYASGSYSNDQALGRADKKDVQDDVRDMDLPKA